MVEMLTCQERDLPDDAESRHFLSIDLATIIAAIHKCKLLKSQYSLIISL